MNRDTFTRQMQVLAALWPDRKPTAETMAAYWMALEDLHDSTFEAAVAACTKACKYFPVPAEIREKAREIMEVSGALPPAGESAWEDLLRLLRHWSPDNGWCAPARLGADGHVVWGEVGGPNGYYGAPSPLSDMVQRTVDALGGLGAIKYAGDGELGFLRRDFLAFYGHKREAAIAYGPSLTEALPVQAEIRRLAATMTGRAA